MSVCSVLANEPLATRTRIVAECPSLPAVADVLEMLDQNRRAGGRQPPDGSRSEIVRGLTASGSPGHLSSPAFFRSPAFVPRTGPVGVDRIGTA